VGKILIPTAAVRDEGTSFHYLPPGREVQADEEVVAIMALFFKNRISSI